MVPCGIQECTNFSMDFSVIFSDHAVPLAVRKASMHFIEHFSGFTRNDNWFEKRYRVENLLNCYALYEFDPSAQVMAPGHERISVTIKRV